MLCFYVRSVEDTSCDVEVSVFFIEMFEGTKRAELIIIIQAGVFWIEYKLNFCIRRQTAYSRKCETKLLRWKRGRFLLVSSDQLEQLEANVFS